MLPDFVCVACFPSSVSQTYCSWGVSACSPAVVIVLGTLQDTMHNLCICSISVCRIDQIFSELICRVCCCMCHYELAGSPTHCLVFSCSSLSVSSNATFAFLLKHTLRKPRMTLCCYAGFMIYMWVVCTGLLTPWM